MDKLKKYHHVLVCSRFTLLRITYFAHNAAIAFVFFRFFFFYMIVLEVKLISESDKSEGNFSK